MSLSRATRSRKVSLNQRFAGPEAEELGPIETIGFSPVMTWLASNLQPSVIGGSQTVGSYGRSILG